MKYRDLIESKNTMKYRSKREGKDVLVTYEVMKNKVKFKTPKSDELFASLDPLNKGKNILTPEQAIEHYLGSIDF